MPVYFRKQEVSLNTPLILKSPVLRPDAELILSYRVDNEVLPADDAEHFTYSTSTVTLRASEALSPTITVDLSLYHYYIVERILTIPIYNINTYAKGKEEYQVAVYLYELLNVPANTYVSLTDSTKKYTSPNGPLCGGGVTRTLYWSSNTALSIYTSTTYGVYQVFASPGNSNNVITINTPSVTIRGSSTYLSSTYYNAMTSIRTLFAVDVYRAPKNNLNIDGFGANDEIFKVINCALSPTHTLT